MTQNLPDAPVPRHKQILPEGVIRAKDNVDDFSFSQKSRQSEAEHNMGYYLAELNNRNEELENLVERQDKDLAALRRENADQWSMIHCLQRKVGTYRIVVGLAIVVGILALL